MTNAELAILGLVAEKPRHGYEIEGVIEARGMRDWTEIGFSSIYYILKKLEDKGFVTSQLEKASGRGPARKVFTVTEEGQSEWYQETLKTLNTPERAPTPFLLGMSALPALPPDQAIQALIEYQEKLSEHQALLKQNWERQASEEPLPYFVDAMFDYSVTLMDAEIEWIKGFIQEYKRIPNREYEQMTLEALPGFKNLATHHCGSGSLRHVYVYNDHPLSEDMLLGIGGGVGFIYWHMKGTAPFIGGRGKGRPKQGFERCVGERTGVLIQDFTTTSAKKAESSLIELLDQGKSVMLQCDMGFLPYFSFGGNEYHFGGHFIVVCGYDVETKTVLIADRDEKLHTVPMDALAQARDSTYQPFAPKNRWFTFDFEGKREPTPEEVREALREVTEEMLHPPITNVGVAGIRKAAKLSLKWPEVLDEELLGFTMFNTHIFIDAQGGTGGGIFRYMFSRFLQEAADIIKEPRLKDCADQMNVVGDRWQSAATLFKQGWKDIDPVEILPETSRQMLEIADLEEKTWGEIRSFV